MDNSREVGHPMDGLMPVLIADKLSMARTLYESGMIPKSLDTPQKVFIALQMGHELGLKPMVAVNNISAINGKPVVGTDLMVGLAKQHPSYRGMEVSYAGEGPDLRCDVVVRREFEYGVEESRGSFSVQDAHEAGLMAKDPWKKYTRRMLKHRATSFALRDAFSDVFAGLHTQEEVQGEDFNEEPRNVTPAQPSGQDQDMLLQQAADTIFEIIDNAHERGTLTEEEKEDLKTKVEKYRAQGMTKLVDFRRFLNSRIAAKERGQSKPKAPKAPSQTVEDAETPEAPETPEPSDAQPGGKQAMEDRLNNLQEDAEQQAEMFEGAESDLGDELV